MRRLRDLKKVKIILNLRFFRINPITTLVKKARVRMEIKLRNLTIETRTSILILMSLMMSTLRWMRNKRRLTEKGEIASRKRNLMISSVVTTS